MRTQFNSSLREPANTSCPFHPSFQSASPCFDIHRPSSEFIRAFADYFASSVTFTNNNLHNVLHKYTSYRMLNFTLNGTLRPFGTGCFCDDECLCSSGIVSPLFSKWEPITKAEQKMYQYLRTSVNYILTTMAVKMNIRETEILQAIILL